MEDLPKNKRAIPSAAIIGCGNIGSLFDERSPAPFPLTHASAYLARGDVQLAAACDQNESRLREFGIARGVSRLYIDFKDLLRNEEIDILSICAHLDSRLETVKFALESGVRHIICEKPLAGGVAEAKEILALGERYGAKIAVNFLRRWNRGIQEVKRLIDLSEDLKIQAVTIYYEKGCLNNGSHAIDLLNFFFGSHIKLLSRRTIDDDRRAGEDPSVTANLQILIGDQLVDVHFIAVDYRHFSIFEIDILHTQGRIKITDAGDRVSIFKIVPDRDCPEYPVLMLDRELTGLNSDLFPNLIKNVVEVFHGRGELICSAKDAFETLKMIEVIRN